MCSDLQFRDIIKKAIPFVLVRRKDTGGFSATPQLPATITDTYHALRILELARRYNAMGGYKYLPLLDNNLHSYLTESDLRLQFGARIRFQRLWCCRIAGLDIDRHLVRETITTGLRTCNVAESWYYHIRILQEVLNEDAQDIDFPAPSLIMAQKWRTVSEAWMRLYLSHALQCPFPLPLPELTHWLQKSQSSDGGFGFFPGTTSFVENGYASLRALNFLHADPMDRCRAFSFLLGCQTISGGFGRSSQAAPFLDTTWHALAALALIA